MDNVTRENFTESYPEIEEALKKAKFITLDTEFSALNPLGISNNSLFDSAVERYKKLRKSVEYVIPLQIGITAFTFDADNNSYFGKTFTFYVCPQPFISLDKTFVCQASSAQFLCTYKFNFNQVFYSGIPYLNKNDEEKLVKILKEDNINNLESSMRIELENLFQSKSEMISKWFKENKVGDSCAITEINEKYGHSLDFMYFIHKMLRNRFQKELWTYINNKQFFVKKVTKEEFDVLSKDNNLEDKLLDKILGFTKIFRLLTKLQKPIIGHNVLTDLMIMINNFECPLPKSYSRFKQFVLELFPTIYDTKFISFELRNRLNDSDKWHQNSLEALYEYFKFGTGRHLARYAPFIGLENEEVENTFHNAGWDSFTTGYIFIRMAHVHLFLLHRKNYIGCMELLNGTSEFKNCLNVIRSSISHIQLDGKDPDSTRPPWLIIESSKNKPIDITEVTCALSNYGRVEVKPISQKGRRALVAVDNYASANRILRQFEANSDEFRVRRYSILRHSTLARAVMWGGVATSGALAIWFLHTLTHR